MFKPNTQVLTIKGTGAMYDSDLIAFQNSDGAELLVSRRNDCDGQISVRISGKWHDDVSTTMLFQFLHDFLS